MKIDKSTGVSIGLVALILTGVLSIFMWFGDVINKKADKEDVKKIEEKQEKDDVRDLEQTIRLERSAIIMNIIYEDMKRKQDAIPGVPN